MLAAIPLLLSLVSASIVPVAEKSEDSLIQRAGSPFEIRSSKRDGFSIGGDIASQIGEAIDSTIDIPGVNNTDILNDIVGTIDKDLSNLQKGFGQLDPSRIGEIIEEAVGGLGLAFAGVKGQLIEAIREAIEKAFGIKIIPAGPHVA